MRRGTRLLVFAVLLVGAGVFVWKEEFAPSSTPGAQQGGGEARPSRRGGGGRRGGGQEGPVSILTQPSRVQDVPVTLDAVGTVQALNTVTVRSQVDGRLLRLAFQEGQDVKAGDILAEVDPTIYQAQYDQAVAKKAQDEASLANARIDLVRYIALASTAAGSKQQADTQRAMVAQLEAQVKSDQGQIDNARAYLDWTKIRAPIDGRLGIRLVDQGNLVRASDSTGIVVITQLRPITVLFNLPQQNLRAVNAAMGAAAVKVEALEADNRTALDLGILAVVDNQVDQATGTVKLKATFPNAVLQLWPGAFVNVRTTVDILKNATVVPTAAIQRGPNGTFVYGVADGKAVLKPVAIARQTETITVVTSGVTPPERVITTGFARLTDGEKVTVADPPGPEAEARPQAGPAAAPPASGGEPGQRRRRQGADGQAGESRTGESRTSESRTGEGQAGQGRRENRGEGRGEGARRSRESRADGSSGQAATPPDPAGAPSPERPTGTGSTRP